MNLLANIIVRDQEEEDFDLYESVYEMAREAGWDNVLKEAYRTLVFERFRSLWYGAACVIWYAAADGIRNPISTNEIIARLYWCLDKYPDLGNGGVGLNLVWSAVVALKGISYNSDWDPLQDKDIQGLIRGFSS